MKSVLVGVGQAGGKVTAAITDHDDRMGYGAVQETLAANSAEADLQSLPIDSVLIGQDVVNGHGVGGDNELGVQVMEADVGDVLDALDPKVGSHAEAIVVAAGLGGGTGSGGAPVLVRELRRVYDVPVYALGVLPGRDEGAMYHVNAGRSLKTLLPEADATFLVDNDAWREGGESVDEGYAAINENVARRFGLLFAAGEIGAGSDVAESVVDTSEIVNTLRPGGAAAVGYAAAPAGEDASENVNTVMSAIRKAVRTGTSLPNASTAETALVVVAGEPERVPRKGVERGRQWVEEETGSMQVRGGDFPVDGDRVEALVVLGGVERSDRLRAFMDRAREAAAADETEEDPTEALQSDELDGLL